MTPPGWSSRRQALRFGEADPVHAFDMARQGLLNWTQYDLAWTSVPIMPPIELGAPVAILARTARLWSVNCCRLVYVIDEPKERFGYAMGTLPHHPEKGEERFLLTRVGMVVQLEVTSFSEANHPLVQMCWWYAQRTIRRFLREGIARVSAEVDRPSA